MVRRLAAILVVDMVDSSRLMEADEVGTLAAFKGHREQLIEPAISEHNGRIVKLTGDGALVEFASVVDAVTCALAVQDGMAGRNEGVPEDRRVVFRIGVHLGDVMIEQDDIYGDGVNVAARLEGLAEPDGICISQQALDQVETKLDLAYKDMGEQRLKNIARPVHAYQVRHEGRLQQSAATLQRRTGTARLFAVAAAAILIAVGGVIAWWQPWSSDPGPATAPDVTAPQPDRPSIAVLPFANLSDDQEQEYFADGMTGDLITDLSKVSGLIVIARSSVFTYKGRNVKVQEVAKDLNVSYVLEGSVRRVGGQLRINAQLVDARTGTHLWAERYDHDMEDIFALQDDVLDKIIGALAITMTPSDEKRLARRLTDNPEAYDYYLKGLRQVSFFNKEANREAQLLFKKAIELDPSFASAHAYLAQAYSLMVESDWTDRRQEAITLTLATAKKAVELDGELPYAYWSLGRIYSRSYMYKHEEAIKAFTKSVVLDPNYADGYVMLGSVQNYIGEAEAALASIEKGMRLNPRAPFWYVHTLGQSQFHLTRYEAAAEAFNKAIERNPTVAWPRRWLIATYGHLEMIDEAEWQMLELEILDQPVSVTAFEKRLTVQDPDYLKRLIDGYRKAGAPE